MSRPVKNNRDSVLSEVLPPIRCTSTEKQEIYDYADKAGLSVSAYVREMAVNGKIVVRHSDIDFESIQQLRKLGVNLNQLTKKFNATGKAPGELKALWSKLDILMERLLKQA
jgi:hypothetical protein